MSSTNNTNLRGFRKAWGMLPADEQPRIKEKIKQTCGWSSDTTFSTRMMGHSELRPLELQAIKAIFAAWNINVETGKYIHKFQY